jgi:hypothetical protein
MIEHRIGKLEDRLGEFIQYENTEKIKYYKMNRDLSVHNKISLDSQKEKTKKDYQMK